MSYDFKAIEEKWQKAWEENHAFEAKSDYSLPKFYALVEFPYPSGSGMHVGHIKAYSGLEVVSRKKRMQGYNVLFPIGFDAFGLPTENSAIKFNTHPRVLTDKNIEKFTSQLKKVGFSFDWTRVVDTTDEDYYKWTQWIFRKMFDEGLVFRATTLVNYCPHCKVVLSNEDSQGGKCDICHNDIVQKAKDVWYLRITEYADKLLQGLEKVDTAVLCGDDSLTVPMISVGAKGVISVASNLIPGELSTMVGAALAGDFAAALELHRKYYRVFKDLFIETNPIPIKAAMAMAGHCNEEYRLPLCEMAPANREKLALSLKSCGISDTFSPFAL